MKKICKLVLIILTVSILFLSGCVQGNYADVSENIKYVSAGYYLDESVKEPDDRLTKNAELIYTNMKITPKENLTVTGVSFDAKLKDENAEAIFKLNIYVIKENEDNTQSLNNIGSEIVITSSEKNIIVTLDTPYVFDFTGFDVKNTYVLCIEFLNENNIKNTTVCFSLNDIVLLT